MAKIEIDVGGTGSGSYISGSGLFTGGADASHGTPLITTGLIDPAPDAVNQSVRFDATSFSRTLTGLVAGETYKFRVHSAWHSTSYSFRVKANTVSMGTLSFTTPTDDYTPKILEFEAVANGSGEIALVFESISTFALVSALQYWQNTGGSTVPDDITGFTATPELAAGISLAWDAGTDDLEIDHYRIQRDTVNTFDSINLATINTDNYFETSYFESLDPLTQYFYRIKGVDGDGNLSANWATDDTTTLAAVGKINCGGGAVGDWIADAYFTGGTTSGEGTAADTTGLTDPADPAVYLTWRIQGTGDFSYTIPNLRPNSSYFVRLHFKLHVVPFAQRITGDGAHVSFITYDVANKARIREFYLNTNAEGELVLGFHYNAGNNSFVSGISFELQDPPADLTDVNIIVLGDSIPCGYPFYDNSYPGLLAGLLNTANANRFSSPVVYDAANRTTVHNLGIPGDTLANMATRFTEDVVSRINPDATNIFVVQGGSNDLAGGSSAATLAAAIFDLTADAKTAGCDWCVTLEVTPRSDVAGANETKRTDLNALLVTSDASVDEHIPIATIDTDFANTSSAVYSDESVDVHYSELGNAAVADMLFDVVTALALVIPKTLRLTWSPSGGFPSGYKLRRATDAGFTLNVTNQTLGSVTEYDDELTITGDTTFYYKLLAFDVAGNESEYSAPENISVTKF